MEKVNFHERHNFRMKNPDCDSIINYSFLHLKEDQCEVWSNQCF